MRDGVDAGIPEPTLGPDLIDWRKFEPLLTTTEVPQ